MRGRGRARSWGRQANQAAHQAAQRIDDSTGQASERLAGVIVPAVRLLRWPTAVVLGLSAPFVVLVLVLGVSADGWLRVVIVGAGIVMALVWAAFWGRRRRILQAVADPEQLGTELRQLVNLTSRLDETGDAFKDITGGGGWRLFGRLRAVWRGVGLPARWLDQVGELPRARYFAPPKIGTTVTVTVAALWLVPISIVVAVVAVVGSIAGSL